MSHRSKNRTATRVRPSGPAGTLDVLSVGHGHMKLTITPGDDAEAAKARTVIEDLLMRGAAIFVEQADGSTRRVKKFDAKKMVYYIDPPDELPEPEPQPEPTATPKTTARKRELVGVPVGRARATAVGRMAGG